MQTRCCLYFSEVLKLAGLVEKNVLVTAQREDLIGQHIGETEEKTKAIINSARGATLLIDEVYRLAPVDSQRDFGPEALDTLMSVMEGGPNTTSDRPAIIMAGYPESTKRVLDVNPGLARRITDKFHFPDYTIEELVKIMMSMAEKDKFLVDADISEIETAITNSVMADILAKHNAGFSARVFSTAKMEADKRMSELIMQDQEPSDESLQTICTVDFLNAVQAVKASL